MDRVISMDMVAAFKRWLYSEEKSRGTIEKYCRDVRNFQRWMKGSEVSREAGFHWKEQLLQEGYNPATINSMAAALNTFFRFEGWQDCRIRFLRIQRKTYRSQHRHLDKADYDKLVRKAEKQGRDLAGTAHRDYGRNWRERFGASMFDGRNGEDRTG